MNFFKVGDKVKLNQPFGGIPKGKVFIVVKKVEDSKWLHEDHQAVALDYINRKAYFVLFDLFESKDQQKIVKALPSWLKEAYYNHYVEIVTDFIKEYAKDHDISMTEGNETVLTATPRKKGN